MFQVFHIISSEQSCNIMMPSFVLFLCQLSTITHNMRYSLTFLVTYSTKCCFVYLVFHIVCSQCLFLSHTQQGFHLNFQVSFSQPFPCVYFICCFWHISYKLSTHPCAFAKFFFSLIQTCLNSFLFNVSLYSIVSYLAQLSHFQSMAQLNY